MRRIKNGRSYPKIAMTRKGRLLPMVLEHRTNPALIRDGAHAMRRAYLSNGLSRRSREGLVLSNMEKQICALRGFKSMEEAPPTLQIKVRLLLGNLLFLSMYEPALTAKHGYADWNCAANLCNRICNEIGIVMPKIEKSLNEYLAECQEAAE